VVTASVEQKSMPVTLPAVGTVEAPLFSLDPRPFQAALQQADPVGERASSLRRYSHFGDTTLAPAPGSSFAS